LDKSIGKSKDKSLTDSYNTEDTRRNHILGTDKDNKLEPITEFTKKTDMSFKGIKGASGQRDKSRDKSEENLKHNTTNNGNNINKINTESEKNGKNFKSKFIVYKKPEIKKVNKREDIVKTPTPQEKKSQTNKSIPKNNATDLDKSSSRIKSNINLLNIS